MNIRFTKMLVCGNDYIIADCFAQNLHNAADFAKRVTKSRVGIGGAELITVSPCKEADAQIEAYNPNGNISEYCADGALAAGAYLLLNKITSGNKATIKTQDGIKTVTQNPNNSFSLLVGKAEFAPCKIPLRQRENPLINTMTEIGGGAAYITALRLCGAHCVVINSDVSRLNLPFMAPAYAYNSIFQNGVNVEFIQIVNNTWIKVRPWGHDVGELQGSASSAAAALAAALENKLCTEDIDVKISFAGGDLILHSCPQKGITITGEGKIIFKGEIEEGDSAL
ncbi:MAG: diaminopimelate epimerase [Oscillospiraceae bacterium]